MKDTDLTLPLLPALREEIRTLIWFMEVKIIKKKRTMSPAFAYMFFNLTTDLLIYLCRYITQTLLVSMPY